MNPAKQASSLSTAAYVLSHTNNPLVLFLSLSAFVFYSSSRQEAIITRIRQHDPTLLYCY